MSAECARAAACSLSTTRSGRRPCSVRTRFIAPMIRLSDVREKTAAEAPEITESAITNAAQSAATCAGERIGGHSEERQQLLASPKWGIRGQKSSLNANFVRAELRRERPLRPGVGRNRATRRARETPPPQPPAARASRQFRRSSQRRAAAP